jgi:hypothetical protein
MTGFVSGLQGDPAPEINPRGFELLQRIRERAEAELRDLAPSLQRCFDGDRWVDPQPDDVAAADAAHAGKALVDIILTDKTLCAWITTRLARAGVRR